MTPKAVLILSTLVLALNVTALDPNTFSPQIPANSDRAACACCDDTKTASGKPACCARSGVACCGKAANCCQSDAASRSKGGKANACSMTAKDEDGKMPCCADGKCPTLSKGKGKTCCGGKCAGTTESSHIDLRCWNHGGACCAKADAR